jgi:hypothetical protein
MYWAQDNCHVAGNAHHLTHLRIVMWCAIHGNTPLGPVFLEGVVKAAAVEWCVGTACG